MRHPARHHTSFKRGLVWKHRQLLLLGGLLLILFVGSIVSLKLVNEDQDLRQSASVQDGSIKVTTAQATPLHFNQPSKIEFKINTNQVQVDGVQLEFTIDSVVTDRFDIMEVENSGLKLISKQIHSTGPSSYAGQIVAIADIGKPFSSTNDVTFAQLVFTPLMAGEVSLTFDQENSISTVFESSPVRDELAPIVSTTFTVTEPPDFPDSGTNVTPVPDSPTPAPKQCNQQCNSNADCAVNLACHSGVCRLAINPSSSSCSPTANQPQLKSCNQTCGNNSECQAGLTCYANRCRNPLNQTSPSCQNPTATPTPTRRPQGSAGTGGIAYTNTSTPTSTPSTQPTSVSISPQPTNAYLEQLEQTESGVTDVFGNQPQIDRVVTNTPTPTPRQVADAVSSPEPTQPVNPIKQFAEQTQHQSQRAISRNTLLIIIAIVFLSLPLIFFGPSILSGAHRVRKSKAKMSHLEHEVKPHVTSPTTKKDSDATKSSNEITYFAGNRDALDKKDKS